MEDVSRDILIRAAEGDMQAFEKVYRATCGFVFNVALRVTGNGGDAEEVTQDVFMKIYRHLKRFQFRSAFRTWVYRITVNTALNKVKRSAKENIRRADFDTALRSQAAPGTADEGAVRRDSQEQVASLLGSLNPDQRACIVLREIEGLSYRQISEALTVNVNTVRSRLKRARQAILAVGKGEVRGHEM